MKAIILAAGRGSRMGDHTDERPKCMTELGGKPLLHWQLDALREAGIDDVAIVTGYRAESLAPFASRTFHNPRWAETNMVMSLAAADPWLRSEPCVVAYADIVYDASAVRSLIDAGGDIVLSSYRGWRALWEARFDDPLRDAETFRKDATGRLLEIGRRAASLDEVQGQYMGLLRFTPSGWASVSASLAAIEPSVRDRLDMTSLLQRLLQAGVRIDTMEVDGTFFEVDTPSDLALYEGWLDDDRRARSVRRGDFTSLAKSYAHRPGYSHAVLRMIGRHVGAGRDGFVIADVGAGTGKLTEDLFAIGFGCRWAVEPNDAMRGEGEVATAAHDVEWRAGRGEHTGLDAESVDWVLMASSFHWVDLAEGLAELHRILKPGGHFTALWNPRDIHASALHQRIEAVIEREVSGLTRVSSGASPYTKDLSQKLVSTGHFRDPIFVEAQYSLDVPRERYMGAWRSVNDIQAQAGPERFEKILAAIEAELGDLLVVPTPYKTRAWTVSRVG